MEIAIASDHAGYDMKDFLIKYLEDKGYNMIDLGAENADDRVDFPDFAEKLTKEVKDGNILGIGICGTGIGMSIACNKVKSIHAALCHTEYDAKMAREHNNAQILCIGGRTTDFEEAEKIVETFLNSKYLGGKYEERNVKIGEMEK